MMKHPSHKTVSLEELARNYHALSLKDALTHFIVHHTNPSLTKVQVETQAVYLDLPFRTLPVYHKAKFWLDDNEHYHIQSDELNVALVVSPRANSQKQPLSAQFDTVLVNGGSGKFLGVAGMSSNYLCHYTLHL
ncbi:hypothetical protein BDY19DRAFT_891825 [Irpex rosettiformis]|uniref:Uncharacterized protein n=1 Tax=Irpex rosettiformis TaxID=378272 RepID=A0ACB8U0W0_9APHY|nr:hypothetical protein BDY19DRAFT_891825 [Irpex rosettiformis]